MRQTFNITELAQALGVKESSLHGNRGFYERKLLELGYNFTIENESYAKHRLYHFELEEGQEVSYRKPITHIWDRHNQDAGIYKITCKETGELLYIGQTISSFSQRWQGHVAGVRGKGATTKHRTNKLVREYNQNGYTLVFEAVYTVPKNNRGNIMRNLDNIEYYYIQTLNPLGNIARKELTPEQIKEVEKLIKGTSFIDALPFTISL